MEDQSYYQYQKCIAATWCCLCDVVNVKAIAKTKIHIFGSYRFYLHVTIVNASFPLLFRKHYQDRITDYFKQYTRFDFN